MECHEGFEAVAQMVRLLGGRMEVIYAVSWGDEILQLVYRMN